MEPREIYGVCVRALRDFVRGTGISDVVIGLSGGIDSSIVTVMACDALGSEHVHGVLLPGPYSTEHSVDDAEELAHNLGIATETISICEPFEAFEQVLGRVCGGELDGVAAENTQARCRTVCIMALANTFNWLMINTGNRSEAMMGYSTLYGDTAGVFAPIGGLYKTDVYAISRWRNLQVALDESAPIPEHVLVKPPSAELAPNQQDEASFGVDYGTLDRILIACMERGETTEAFSERESLDKAEVERVVARARAFAFKRTMEPPFPDVNFYA